MRRYSTRTPLRESRYYCRGRTANEATTCGMNIIPPKPFPSIFQNSRCICKPSTFRRRVITLGPGPARAPARASARRKQVLSWLFLPLLTRPLLISNVIYPKNCGQILLNHLHHRWRVPLYPFLRFIPSSSPGTSCPVGSSLVPMIRVPTRSGTPFNYCYRRFTGLPTPPHR